MSAMYPVPQRQNGDRIECSLAERQPQSAESPLATTVEGQLRYSIDVGIDFA